MALQELSTNVINTMVKQSTTRKAWLRISLLICVAVLGVQTIRGQHAFEWAARVGANALLYQSDYGKPIPNYNVGMDFSWKYRSPYYIGVRMGLGIDVAASTFMGVDPNHEGIGYADNYVVPNWYDYDHDIVNYSYELGRFTETQQLIIASAPIQLGLFLGDFSMFLGARVGVPVHGCYWQRVREADVRLEYPSMQMEDGTPYVIGKNTSGEYDPVTGEYTPIEFVESLQAGVLHKTVNGIKPLTSDAFHLYNYHITAMVDLNYSFKVGDNTDFAIGAYLEYDPIGFSPKVTDNTSLMEWRYAIDEHTNNPVFRRDYHSVLLSNRADGVTMRHEGELGETPVVKKYHRASVGLRLSISLWSVPLDFGKNYRKQQLYKVCMCDFF